MTKRASLLLIVILTVSSLIVVKPENASAQITTPTPTPPAPTPTPTPTPPKPLVPEFTVKLISSLPEANQTTIELTIKNQPFDKNNTYHYSFFYNVRTRINDGNWSDIYNPEDGYPTQSNSDYTVLSFSSTTNGDGYFIDTASQYNGIYAPSNAKVDFQVEAMIGYRDRSWKNFSGGILPYAFEGETSGWSNTQTLTISDSPTPSPSPTPNKEPLQMEQLATILGIVIVAMAVTAILLVYYKKRKH